MSSNKDLFKEVNESQWDDELLDELVKRREEFFAAFAVPPKLLEDAATAGVAVAYLRRRIYGI